MERSADFLVDPEVFRGVYVLTGPTASGKSAVGLLLAEALGAEIVSMDSMAVYRGLDIGTAKPGPQERARVKHHLLDVLDPWEGANVAWWLRQAAGVCQDLARRGQKALIVGGTPMYLKALLRGLFAGPAAQPALREHLARLPGDHLHARLREHDPEAARRIHPHDIRRLVRALEVIQLTGQPLSAMQHQFAQIRWHGPVPVWLAWPRQVLYRRIEERVDRMLAAGWLDEVRRLEHLPRPLSHVARQALGYRELLEYLDGVRSWEDTITLIKTRSRQFARRQLSWFRHLPELRAVVVHPEDSPQTVAERILALWRPNDPDSATQVRSSHPGCTR